MFEAFQERDYRRFWFTQFLSNIGSWMQAVAQGWLVYRLTDSAFLLGFVGFANSAPALFLMLPAGVLADQLDRKRVVAISQWAQGGSALWLAIAIWFDFVSVWHIVGAALVVGIAQSFSAPAWQAMVVDLLDDRSRLSNAVAMNSLQFQFSRVVGPILAGVALSTFGSFWCFLLNALSFLPLIFVLGRIKPRQQPGAADGQILSRLREGFAFVRTQPVLIGLLGIVAAGSLFGLPYITVLPVVARELFVDDAGGLGWLMACVGAGALAGSLSLSIHTPARIRRVVVVSLLTFGAGLVGAGVASERWLVMCALVICGVSMVVSMALCNTSIQQRIPDEMRGRVLSMYTYAFFAFFPFGNLIAGAIAERRGIMTALVVMGAGMLLTGVAAAIFLPRRAAAAAT